MIDVRVLVTNDLTRTTSGRRRAIPAAERRNVVSNILAVGGNPIGRDCALGDLQINSPVADQFVQPVFQFVFDGRIVWSGDIGLWPEVLNRITAAEFQADQVIDLILVRLVRGDAVAGISPVPFEELLVSYHQVFPFGKARGSSSH